MRLRKEEAKRLQTDAQHQGAGSTSPRVARTDLARNEGRKLAVGERLVLIESLDARHSAGHLRPVVIHALQEPLEPMDLEGLLLLLEQGEETARDILHSAQLNHYIHERVACSRALMSRAQQRNEATGRPQKKAEGETSGFGVFRCEARGLRHGRGFPQARKENGESQERESR